MNRRFRLVDVFGESPMTGNPLAVVVDCDGLDKDDMISITRWLNFSETTFLLPPDDPAADYRVRIFTLAGELPFAGHPTLGTCHVFRSLQDAGSHSYLQECGAGLIRVRARDDSLAFAAPPLLKSGSVEPSHVEMLATVLGIDVAMVRDSAWVDNGPGWVGLMLEDAEQVLELVPDFSKFRGGGRLDLGVVGLWPDGAPTRYEVRAFFSDQHGGMVEDPVTGSLNASLAQWLIGVGRVTAPFVASQGTALGRRGRVRIEQTEDGQVWVGGQVFDVVTGTI